MLEVPAFLDVEASVTGRRWYGPSAEHDRMGQAIAQAAGLPEIVGRVLAQRGVPPAEAAAYLAPALRPNRRSQASTSAAEAPPSTS